MAATIDTTNVASTSVNGGGSATTITVNCTCAAADNFLLVAVGVDSSAGAAPTSVTYNSVAMTAVPSGSKTNTQEVVSWYYMNTPPTGSAHAVLATFAAGTNAMALVAIPMSGVNLASAPVAGTGTQGVPSASIACSTPNPDANSIAFAATTNRGTSQTPGGAPMVNVIAPINTISGTTCFAASYIPGVNTASFTWTITSGNWSAIGVTVQGTASGPQYITKWTPFRWACAMRSLQQGANNVGNRQQNRAALLASAITNANGAATWAKWRVGENSRVSSCGLVLNVPLVPGFVPPVGTVDDGT